MVENIPHCLTTLTKAVIRKQTRVEFDNNAILLLWITYHEGYTQSKLIVGGFVGEG
jgi:hypothetical protein